MRARLLHVALVAPLAALAVIADRPAVHALAAGGPPQPVVVTIDPGHGGSANPDNPSQLFDPGAIASNGVEEKDVTLDVGERVAALLRQDDVDVVLTRTTDEYLTIPQREQTAIDSRASLFVSIHVNSFTDPSVGGSLVLYPSDSALPFAQALSDALGRDLAAAGVPDDGVQLRDNWWIHAPMPTATVEMAYLTNAHEEVLLATEVFRQQVAVAIRDGVESYDPQIAVRSRQIRAWRSHHRIAAAPAPARARGGRVPAVAQRSQSPLRTALVSLLLVATAIAVLRRPRLVLGVVASAIAQLLRPDRAAMVHRRWLRRRRRKLARQAERAMRRPSVYDELWL